MDETSRRSAYLTTCQIAGRGVPGGFLQISNTGTLAQPVTVIGLLKIQPRSRPR